MVVIFWESLCITKALGSKGAHMLHTDRSDVFSSRRCVRRQGYAQLFTYSPPFGMMWYSPRLQSWDLIIRQGWAERAFWNSVDLLSWPIGAIPEKRVLPTSSSQMYFTRCTQLKYLICHISVRNLSENCQLQKYIRKSIHELSSGEHVLFTSRHFLWKSIQAEPICPYNYHGKSFIS